MGKLNRFWGAATYFMSWPERTELVGPIAQQWATLLKYAMWEFARSLLWSLEVYYRRPAAEEEESDQTDVSVWRWFCGVMLQFLFGTCAGCSSPSSPGAVYLRARSA